MGQVALQAEKRYRRLWKRMSAGEVPPYEESLLDEVYLCPYVRAIRLIDEICAHHPLSQSYCLGESVRMEPSPSALGDTLYSTIAARGTCTAERAASAESLLYQPVEPTL